MSVDITQTLSSAKSSSGAEKGDLIEISGTQPTAGGVFLATSAKQISEVSASANTSASGVGGSGKSGVGGSGKSGVGGSGVD